MSRDSLPSFITNNMLVKKKLSCKWLRLRLPVRLLFLPLVGALRGTCLEDGGLPVDEGIHGVDHVDVIGVAIYLGERVEAFHGGTVRVVGARRAAWWRRSLSWRFALLRSANSLRKLAVCGLQAVVTRARRYGWRRGGS